MENTKDIEIHFLGAINMKESDFTEGEEKLKIVFLAGYERQPNAWEYCKLRNALSRDETFAFKMEDIMIVPFSEEICRSQEEVEQFYKMKGDMIRQWQEYVDAQTVDGEAEIVE